MKIEYLRYSVDFIIDRWALGKVNAILFVIPAKAGIQKIQCRVDWISTTAALRKH
jgi:hypothetical protein